MDYRVRHQLSRVHDLTSLGMNGSRRNILSPLPLLGSLGMRNLLVISQFTRSPSRTIRSVHLEAWYSLLTTQCKRKVDDLLRTVHPLPSVRIQEGLVHLREGTFAIASSSSNAD